MEPLQRDDVVARIWRRDHTLWKQDPVEIVDRLGWLDVAAAMRPRVEELQAFAARVADDGFTDAILLGMGGSSLAAETIRTALGAAPGMLELTVLDTTHPGALRAVEERVDLDRAVFVVASKSGSTIETRSHLEYFWSKRPEGERFIAITDPGSGLEALARERGFRAVFLNPDDIGGRYSALSLFGLVPAALVGVDLDALLEDGARMADACRAAGAENPGAMLGEAIGRAALAGADKLTLLTPASMGTFGAWVEQLVAESTGKEGRGILPVVGEPLGPPEVYGEDRIFVSIGATGDALDELERNGHRVLRVSPDAHPALGEELYRWEFATAVAGWVFGINPFDQPNVAEAKEATARILAEGAGEIPGLDDVEPLLKQVRAGDYVAILAYLDPFAGHDAALEAARVAIRDRLHVATTVGYGPRYLHSTGQLHKGGPDGGVFVQVVDPQRANDEQIPGASYTFGALLDAQALGDLRSLRARGRRVARVTLEQLEEAIA